MSSVIPLPDGGKIVKTNCFECHAKCGVLCEVDKNGKLVKVKGNPEDPRSQGRMCGKGLSATRILYDPHRLRYPLRRVGERGEGKWEQISWDEAIEWLAQKIEKITEEHGAEAITYGQGTGRGTNQWTARSGNAGGRVHHSTAPGNICLVPMMVQAFFQYGMFPTFDGCDFDNADCIVFWGANSVWTEPTYTSGQVGRSRDRGAKLIVIDPYFEHPLAAKADHFVPVRPGSDTFLAMAWINIIINEDLYDYEFVQKYTNAPMLLMEESELPLNEAMVKEGGDPKVMLVWDKAAGVLAPVRSKGIDEDIWFRGEILGADGNPIKVKTVWHGFKDRADAMPPEKAAELCWIKPEVIYDSCRTYAKAPSATINVFQGIEEQTNCKDSLHLIYDIIALTGNLEKKGGNLSMPFWNQMRGLGGKPPATQQELRMVDERATGTLYGVSNPTNIFEAMRTGKPYPIKGYISVQGNPLSWSENTAMVKESLKCLELLCIMDYYMSPSCELADLVLPSTHWTERDYLADEVCSEWVFGQQKAVEPLYERKSDVWFWRTLGHRLHPDWWPWETDEELFDWQLQETKAGITWAELKEKWIHKVPDFPSRNYPENGFPTPSGRVELYSIVNKMMGAHPFGEATEVKNGPYTLPEEIVKEYPLIAITGRRYPIYYHSAYRGIPHLRELVPEPQVTFNSKLARELGIEDGEDVWIESPVGKITMKAKPSDGIHENVCVIPHGWWQACPELGLAGYPDGIANANTLTSDQYYNDEYMTPGLRSTMVKIYKK
ncbi:MAG: molybdopterin-dependent oxidoreductase [Firmicutes bacterium]|nr:molybdopterin-dependent oxidoreductase [Bacillota bacterium]